MTVNARKRNERRVNHSIIPEEMKQLNRWVNWKLVPRKGEPGKFQKVPLNSKTGFAASCDEPATWSSFEEAVQRFEQDEVDGIGFQLGEPYVGMDIDHCRDPQTGEIKPWVTKMVRAMGTYTEVSPSGTGLHLMMEGRPPSGKQVFRFGDSAVEIYASKRYLTVTGRHLLGTPYTVEHRNHILQWVHGKLSEKSKQRESTAPQPLTTSDNSAHEKNVANILALKNGSPLKKLWNGDCSAYGSRSEADQAFCTRLALRFGCNASLIDSVYRKSKLFREKWDEIHDANGRTYGQRTIATAMVTALDRFQKKHSVYTPHQLTVQVEVLDESPYIVQGLIPALLRVLSD